MAPSERPIVHFVGSLPVADAEAAFRTVAGALGPSIRRLTDGETGRRRRWIGFVGDQLAAHPDLEIDPDLPVYQFKQWDGKVAFEIERLKFRDGADLGSIEFATGYADDALRSFEIFDRLQGAGEIPDGVKYQICSATPLAISYMYLAPAARDAFTGIYTDHLLSELSRIADALPHDRISWQWDVCQEVLMLEGYFEQHPGYREEIFSVLGRIGNAVPADIDLGYHLCYGSPKDEHCVQPKDMTVLVGLANGIAEALTRPLSYIHMPVPRERNDEAYFRPLEALVLPAGCALFLGLVHDGDDAGNRARLEMAERFADAGGVAAECGLGRGDPDRFAALLEAHRSIVNGD